MIDNWIEIVETLQQCMRGNLKEAKYQQEIENCLKFLGWRTSNKTMQSQLILGFGSGSKLRPDITLYKNGIPVLPIEIKRPDNVCNDKQIGQLGNYMRQLKLNVGLYFGENIRFYYDNPNDLDNPINVFSVEFSEEDANGMLFCEMLSYEKFDIKKMDDFCKEHYNQIVSRNNLCQRFSEFFAENIVTKNIVTLIKDKFIKEGFDEYVINDELSQLICRIEWKHTPKIVKQTDNSVINISETEKNETKFSLDGDKFFYTNPLEIDQKKYKNEAYYQPPFERVKVFDCSCCPPNVLRMLASLPRYMYTSDRNTIYCNQFSDCETKFNIGGKEATLIQKTNYPSDGKIEFTYYGEPITLFVRIPEWCVEYQGETQNGFAEFSLNYGDTVSLELPMNIHFIEANPNVQNNSGRYAVTRGPIVYCMEGIDNGENLSDITLIDNNCFEVKNEDGIPAPVIYIPAERRKSTDKLYKIKNDERIKFTARLIPYFSFSNRTVTDMLIWTMVK